MKLHAQLIASMGEPNAARAWRRAILFRECLERSLEREKLARALFQFERRSSSELMNVALAHHAALNDALELADEDAARASYWCTLFLINFGVALITAWARVLEVLR